MPGGGLGYIGDGLGFHWVGCHTPTNGGNIGMRRSVKIARDIITLFVTIIK
ncbi:hypothetical protein HanPI659440_Chr01g0024621 [Helianthus annuus]|nr:hypothetical protein HanPI659440_Chr01g0024621 [Helianthus annuus]